MTPEQIDRVFGRGRLQMVTGEHVEVFREAVAPGERRRYTKRFLSTREGDYGQWTEREWRILARLIGHGISCVPDVVQFDRGRLPGMQLVQTYDAGATVDQWATLLPVTRDGYVHHHVFEDCAHWWALAHHSLRALDVIHPLELVHLDIKGDNVCIPYAPASFDPDSPDLKLRPVFAQLALIDFAFALISRESLTTPLPIGWQKEYDYQSPRLLAALEAGRNGELKLTRELDWRCDMFSLAAMLRRYLPDEVRAMQPANATGWSAERYAAAKAFILDIRDSHDSELPAQRPHAALIERSGARLCEPELALSLELGWTLAREASVSSAPVSLLTPVTRLAAPVRVIRSGRITAVTIVAPPQASQTQATGMPDASLHAGQLQKTRAVRRPLALAALFALGALGATLWQLVDRGHPVNNDTAALADPIPAVANHAAPAAVAEEQAASLRSPTRNAEPVPAAPTAAADPARSEPTGANASLPPQAPADASSTANPLDTLPQASAATPPEALAATPSQQRIAQAQASDTSTRSFLSTPVPQASEPSRLASKLARAPSSAKAPVVTQTVQAHAPPPARREFASWASLEPPAWLRRGPGPGDPPGFKAREPVAALVVASAEAVPVPAAATAVRIEPAQPNSQAARQATPVAGAADAPRPRPVLSAIAAQPPPPTLIANAERSALPAVAAGQPPRGSPPIEDRGESAPAWAPTVPEPRSRAVAAYQSAEDNLAAQGLRTLLESVPRIARQTEPEVARVLWMAASAFNSVQERAVAEAARLTRLADDTSLLASAPAEARRLNEQARAASRRNVLEAFNLQLQAFGANPRDPEVASSLALMYLKLRPRQPDMARQVALVALATRGPQIHATRMEDWNTLAVASALSGREVDARNALFVALAVSGNVERTCQSALNALANYGEPLRGPVEAVLYRIHAQGRGYDSSACAWPPNWSAISRLP